MGDAPSTVPKDANGRFCCSLTDCTEKVKYFRRKSEWKKHMDKHERPYKCPQDSCKKCFISSSDLRRHEREIHNQHRGSRKQLNCSYKDCNRHTGKAFFRQENLNNHLRRIHKEETVHGEELDSDSEDLREEIETLSQENQELKGLFKTQGAQLMEMTDQIIQLKEGYGLA